MAAYISFQPTDHFTAYLYTGTGVAIGSGGTAFTGVGFQGDLWWGKQRNGTYRHQVYDSVRGVGKYLAPNTTEVQSSLDAEALTAWGADGFTFGDRAQSNVLDGTFVCWNWKAGTTTGIAGSPTITPTGYSFNATSGFSIIAYTGTAVNATLPHGLGVAPKMIIQKNLADTESWMVYHAAMGPTKYMSLNTTAAEDTQSSRWNDTAPDATVFSIGTDSSTNGSGEACIAYCFADVKGYSKMGGYTGNGNADGTFVYTGFRPAFVMNKRINSTAAWKLHNNKIPAFNVCNLGFSANTVAAESAVDGPGRQLDLLSNGFKWRATDTDINYDGSTYLYAAFAEFPFVSSNSKAGTAR